MILHAQKNRSRKLRHGITLIETVSTLVLLSIITGACGWLVVRWMKMDINFRNELLNTATVDRLSRDIRRDAHESESWNQDSNSFETPHGSQITYTIDGNRIIRKESRNTKDISRQFYLLNRDSRPQWQKPVEGSRLVKLEIYRLKQTANPNGDGEAGTDEEILQLTIHAALKPTVETGKNADQTEVQSDGEVSQ